MDENLKPSLMPADVEAEKVDLGEVVDMVKDAKTTVSYACKLCKDQVPHMVIMMDKGGNIHVHAPFENKYLMNQFQEAIIREQNKYNRK